MKWLAAALFTTLLMLQYRLWLSNDGVREVLRLKSAVAVQQQQNDQLAERNRELAAEVRDLKQGDAALEERARADLGMIGGNETFYQVVPRSEPSAASGAASPTPPSAPPASTPAAAPSRTRAPHQPRTGSGSHLTAVRVH